MTLQIFRRRRRFRAVLDDLVELASVMAAFGLIALAAGLAHFAFHV